MPKPRDPAQFSREAGSSTSLLPPSVTLLLTSHVLVSVGFISFFDSAANSGLEEIVM